MADSVCSACVAAHKEGITLDPEEHTNVFYAELLDVSEATIRRHYKHGPIPRLPETKDNTFATDEPGDVKESRTVSEQSSTGARSFEAVENRPVTLEDARNWIKSSGDDPDDYHYSARSIVYGKPSEQRYSNKMSAWPKPKRTVDASTGDTLDIDPVRLLAALRVTEATYTDTTGVYGPRDGDGAFVLSLNDTQIGKDEGGGTPATIERVYRYVEQAKDRIADLRALGREIGTLVVIGGGDIVEGTCIYPNQSYNVDLASRRDQINVSVTLVLHVIDTLAPLFDEVIVLATRGNHGENRKDGSRTTSSDNDDLLIFEIAQQAVDRDDNLAHVSFIIADSEPAVWVDVAGWRLATTHGDIYGKGVSGPTQDKKAQAWFKNMAMARNPVGAADVLITHHFHHDKMADWGACLWRQTPAMDGGSAWFEQTTGEYSAPGMLTFVMTPEHRYQDEQVLR